MMQTPNGSNGMNDEERFAQVVRALNFGRELRYYALMLTAAVVVVRNSDSFLLSLAIVAVLCIPLFLFSYRQSSELTALRQTYSSSISKEAQTANESEINRSTRYYWMLSVVAVVAALWLARYF